MNYEIMVKDHRAKYFTVYVEADKIKDAMEYAKNRSYGAEVFSITENVEFTQDKFHGAVYPANKP